MRQAHTEAAARDGALEESESRQRRDEAAQRDQAQLEEPTQIMVCNAKGQPKRQRWCWVKCSNGGSTITLLALGCESLPVVLPYILAARVTCDW